MITMVNEKIRNTEFVPYEKILLGSNEVSCRYLINIDGFYPLIIGKGDIPHIWLNVLVNGREFSLVCDNRVNYNGIRVIFDNFKKEISILLEGKTNSNHIILLASYAKNDTFNILRMDLTPIGFSFISNDKELIIGNNHLSGNIVKGVESFISLLEK